MGNYVETRAKIGYFCACKCVKCKEIMVTEGKLQVTSTSRYGWIGTTKSKAYQSTKESAELALRNKIFDLVDGVNSKTDFSSLNASPICKKCYKFQPWYQYRPETIILSVILGFFAGILISLLFDTSIAPLIAVIAIALCSFGIYWLVSKFVSKLTIKWLEKINDPMCYPLVVVNQVPRDVKEDDVRLQAIVAEMLRKRFGGTNKA